MIAKLTFSLFLFLSLSFSFMLSNFYQAIWTTLRGRLSLSLSLSFFFCITIFIFLGFDNSVMHLTAYVFLSIYLSLPLFPLTFVFFRLLYLFQRVQICSWYHLSLFFLPSLFLSISLALFLSLPLSLAIFPRKSLWIWKFRVGYSVW